MVKIDPLLFLFLIEIAVVFCVLAVIFFLRARRYRRLYDEARQLSNTEDIVLQKSVDVVAEKDSALPESSPSDNVTHASEATAEESVPQNVQKLLEIIDFQKQKIIDLLCMRDVLDDAHKQLEMLRQKNIDLENRIVMLVEASAKPEEFSEVSSLLATSNNELKAYINVLQRNSVALGDDIEKWENDLKILWQEAREIAEQLPAGQLADNRPEDVSEELKALHEQLHQRDEKIAAIQTELQKMSAQYEDIEKEYIILYSKQQAAEVESSKSH